jgi:two-component system chemotaxis sensor kinase CheA
MAIDFDDEILKDFLIEATEIVEQLGEQLVELEQAPKRTDLLNAIFRGFHTVKGGAGFLNITPLVELCHRAEDVFNVLRQGEREVEPALMDAVLKALDVINTMLAALRAGQEPEPASPALLEALNTFAVPARGEEKAPQQVPAPAPDPVEQEFEALLAQTEPGVAPQTSPASEFITEEEFEQLLDALHGPGKAPGAVQAPAPPQPKPDEITEEEFEALLDQLHGPGKHRGIPKPLVPQELEALPKEESQPKAESAPLPPAGEKKAQATESTVRVDTQKLDEIMNMVGELVLVRNRFKSLKTVLDDEEMAKAVANLDVVTSDLQLAVMKARMQPIKRVFGRFPRVVRDLARSLGKEVRLETRGEETDLDKNLVEALADPLVHLVRNAVDHGIESPSERERAGKPREGVVILSAAQEGDQIELVIEDDGKGMDPEVLRRKAVEKGLLDEETAARLSDRECFQLIFLPGFSTKTEISDVSGRGVGMDVVKTRITQMNGTVEIDSLKGKGTKVTLKVPLTLAIMPTLMIQLGNQAFALPLSSVVEILDLDLRRISMVDGRQVLLVRDRALPLFYLREWLVREGVRDTEHPGHVVVVNAGGRYVGFVVDHLIGQEEVVIKALGAKLNGLPGLAGATITGDGKIALILDVPGLMKKYAA